MNNAITLIRLPIGTIGSALTFAIWAILFAAWTALEFALAIPVLVFGAVFGSSKWLQESWVGTFPNSFKDFRNPNGSLWAWRTKTNREIWKWVFNPDYGGDP